MQKRIFHVDLDAFYASVEQQKNPEYRGLPVVIGGMPRHRGVVSACSYEARKYGIHSAMPTSSAQRLCPDAIFLPVRMELYQEVSSKIMACFLDFTPHICQISIDEAFLDMTGTEKLFGSIKQTGMMIKKKVEEVSGLTISIGVASTRFIAKLASDFNKPNGLYIVNEGEEIEFLDKLELKHIWGLGKKTLSRLNDFNITDVKSLRKISEKLLVTKFGKSTGSFLYRACRGINIEMYDSRNKSSSISNETTFNYDVTDRRIIENTFLELSHHVMFRSMKEKKKSRGVQIKIRFSDFSTTTAQKTLDHYIHSAEEMQSNCLNLLQKRWKNSEPIRLLGVGLIFVEDADKPEQQDLFSVSFEKNKKVEEAVFKLKNKGEKITKASLLNHEIKNKI